MAFNRNSVNLGNQFAHAAAVSKGEAKENSTSSRDYFKIPAGMTRHRWTEKEERFNILLAKNNASDPDEAPASWKFYKAVPVHELPNTRDPKHPHLYPCPRLIGKPCPCCDEKDRLDDGTTNQENWERIAPYRPKDRMLYYFNPEGTDKISVHECAARQKGEAAFPQRLMAQATAMSEGSTPLPFASPKDDGRIIKVTTAKDSFNGKEFYQPSSVNFFQRKELPEEKLYDRCTPWNEILNFGSEEEMKRVMEGGDPDDFTSQPPQHTEQQKKEEFDRACQQEQRNQYNEQPANTGFTPAPKAQGFTSSPADTPLDEGDFGRDPYSKQPQRQFPSEQAQPAASPAQGNCPNGLRFATDFQASRKCCNCSVYEACRKAKG